MTQQGQTQPTTEPPPIVSNSPIEVASGVYVIPDGKVPFVPNIGIIVGDRAALVVDSGLGPRNGAHVREIARSLAGDRPLFLTLTHFHPEHGFGAQAFGGDTILYNRLQHEEFGQKGAGYLQQFRGMSNAAAQQLEGTELTGAHFIYDGNADLDLGGKLVQLRSWGPAHSRGDQVVFLPEEQVLFTGDLIEDGYYPVLPFIPPYDVDVDGDNWLRVIEHLQALAPRIVVPGHGDYGDASRLAPTHDFISLMRSETQRLAAEGQTADEITSSLVPQFQQLYPDWDATEPWRVAMGVQSFLAHQAGARP